LPASTPNFHPTDSISQSGSLADSETIGGLDSCQQYYVRVKGSYDGGTTVTCSASGFVTDCVSATATTAASSGISKTAATLNGTIVPNDFDVGGVQFTWGASPGVLDQTQAASPASVTTVDVSTVFTGSLSSLSCGTP